MQMKKSLVIVVLALLTGGCPAVRGPDQSYENRPETDSGLMVKERGRVPPLDPERKVSEQDCSKPIDTAGGNLMCKGEPTAAERRRMEEEERQRKLAAERRAKLEEEERQAKARMEAEERAARERLERERAAQAARDAAALAAASKARAAEEARLAAESKAREERERQERAAAEARARQRAEQEAREAAERERRRLEQDWLAGRALLESFVAKYGKVEKFKEVAEPINGFLDKTR